MKSSNPVLNENVFSQSRSDGVSEPMTVQGAVNKAFILLTFMLMSAFWVWGKLMRPAGPFEEASSQSLTAVAPFIMGGFVVGIIAFLIMMFKKEWSSFAAPVYAGCQGFVLGGISAVLEMRFPGIAIQAVGLTFGTLFSMLFLYKTGIVRATEKFKMGVFAATGAIALVYLMNFILGFFHRNLPFMYENSIVGIGFSLVVVGIAALNLILDFDFIEQGARQGAAKYMEWYCAFGLMVTLIWLYMEILNLLAKLRSRD